MNMHFSSKTIINQILTYKMDRLSGAGSKEQDYLKIITNLIAPYLAVKNYNYDDLAVALGEIERFIAVQYHEFPEIYENKIKEAKDRFIFLD